MVLIMAITNVKYNLSKSIISEKFVCKLIWLKKAKVMAIFLKSAIWKKFYQKINTIDMKSCENF